MTLSLSLIIPAFVAGILTFLAPCTLPFVPAYLAFISGVSPSEMQASKQKKNIKKKIILNGALYLVGFTVVMILLGVIFGLLGAKFVDLRITLTKVAAIFLIIVGLQMMQIFKLPLFSFMRGMNAHTLAKTLTPGKPLSSVLFGVFHAVWWSPCAGPILGAILTLASTSGTAAQGAFLLFVFSLGLSIPYMLVAFAFGHAAQYIRLISRHLRTINMIGGAFLLIIGILLLGDKLGYWNEFFYNFFSWINYEGILEYL